MLGKGAALGTVLAFMMAVIGLSLPEAIILRIQPAPSERAKKQCIMSLPPARADYNHQK